MSLTEDRHVGRYQDHVIEIKEDGVAKTVSLILDGREAARESCILPQEITLTGSIADGKSAVTAKVIVRFLASSRVALEIDGEPIPLEKVK